MDMLCSPHFTDEETEGSERKHSGSKQSRGRTGTGSPYPRPSSLWSELGDITLGRRRWSENGSQKERPDKRGESWEGRGEAGGLGCGNGEAGGEEGPRPVDGGPLAYSSNSLVLPQIFTEHLLCARHYSRPKDAALNGTEQVPSLMELTFWPGRLMDKCTGAPCCWNPSSL